MTRRHHTPEQIIKKLRDAEVMQAEGQSIAELVKQLENPEQTYYRWRKQYGELCALRLRFAPSPGAQLGSQHVAGFGFASSTQLTNI